MTKKYAIGYILTIVVIILKSNLAIKSHWQAYLPTFLPTYLRKKERKKERKRIKLGAPKSIMSIVVIGKKGKVIVILIMHLPKE